MMQASFPLGLKPLASWLPGARALLRATQPRRAYEKKGRSMLALDEH